MNTKTIIAAAAAMATAITAAGQTTFAGSSICDGAVITLADSGDAHTLQALCDRNDLTFFENENSGKSTVRIEAAEPWFVTGVIVVAGDDTSAAPVKMSVYGRNNAADEWTHISNFSRMKFSGGPYTSYFGKAQGQRAFSEFRIDFEASGEKIRIGEFQLLGHPSGDVNNLATSANGRFDAPASASGTQSLGKGGSIEPVTLKGTRRGDDLIDCRIDYTFGEPVAILAYGITSNGIDRASMRPSAWDFMASENGVDWVTLDRRCNEESFMFSNYMQRFSLPSTGPVIDYAAVADRLLERMSDDFYREYFGGRYLIHSWNSDPSKLGTSFDYWWQAHAIDACVDAYARTGKRIWNTRALQLKKGMYTAYDASRQDLWNAFYDDMEWMAIACTRAAETLPGSSEWLSEAKQLFEWIWGGWSDVDGGGIGWNCNDGRDSKNSCSNAPAMIAAAHLYRLTGEQHYLDKAIMIFDWMLTHSRFDDGFIKDAPHNDDRGWTFSYNQGTWVGGLLELYKITGEDKYRDIALDLLDKCIDGNWYSPAGIMREQGDGDGGLFKGIFIRYITEWILSGKLDQERQHRYAGYLVENARSLYMSSLVKPDYQVMPCWRSRGTNFNGMVNGSADGSYHASVLLSGIFLIEGINRMQSAGLLDGNAVVNPNIGRKYRYYRLRITDNGGSDDVELCGFSLYGEPSTDVTPSDVATLSITGSAIDENGAESVEMHYAGESGESGKAHDFLLADPTVYTENGRYYAAGTRSFEPKGFTLLESTDLHNWSYARPDSLVLQQGRGCWGSTGFWAPHFFRNAENDYIISYVANERCCIARARTIDGDYTQATVEPIDNSEGNIDPFIFRDDDGRYYMYHVRFPGGNILYVCELDPETWKFKPGTLKECFRNTQQWENTGAYPGLVMEGPSVVKLDGMYYMFYSANHYMSPDYAVGYATASSPAGPWTKYEGNPILHRSIVGEKGSGHGEVFFDNEGNMRYMYHVHNSDTQVNPRRTRIVTFNVDKSAGHPYRISADPASVFTPSMRGREGLFSGYVRLREGSYSFTGTDSQGNAVSFDGMEGTCSEAGVYRITADALNRKVSLTPVGDLTVKGTIADGIALPYMGSGIFGGEITLAAKSDNEYSRKNIYFSFGDGTDYYRTAGTNRLSPAGEAIRINDGTYNFRIDMNECLFDISAETDPYRISVFGSSVANGQGADNFHGYAYLYGNQLKSRTSKGDSEYPLYTSGVSIGGNNTVNLLDRYDDLIRDHGKYVVFGLSLGNEGIHGSADPAKVFNQFRDNMLTLIEKARADGKVPVVMNNYTRTDYNATDYNYVRKMNLLIHEWDVPSVNALGAVDDRSGRWVSIFRKDDFHPNGQGHKQMMYAIPPSLFDALASGKELAMERDIDGHELQLTEGAVMTFTPEETVNAFTVAVRAKVSGAGTVLSFTNGSRGNKIGRLETAADGKLSYTTPSGAVVPSEIGNLDDSYHYITLTHYFGAGCTILYIDNNIAFVTKESLTPKTFTIGNEKNAAGSLTVSEVAFWRSAMNSMEIEAHCAGKLLKSSLEICSPAVLPETETDESGIVVCAIPNLAMSLNAITYEGRAQSGIAPVIGCMAAVPVGYYTIDGRPADVETPGLYIVRFSDGTCRKLYRR